MRASRSSSPGCCCRCSRLSLSRRRQIASSRAPRHVRRRIEIQMRGSRGAHDRALVDRRQPAVGPVVHAVDRQATRIGQHDERRQVLALAAQAVGQPAAQRGPAGDGRPVFSAKIDWPWLLTPVCIERMSVMSSTIRPRWGSSSESSMPHWPRLRTSRDWPRASSWPRRRCRLISPGYWLAVGLSS